MNISVVGFDDIKAVAPQNPHLATVRQPLPRMWKLAASVLLERIANPLHHPKDIYMDPDLIVRELTCAVVKTQSAAA